MHTALLLMLAVPVVVSVAVLTGCRTAPAPLSSTTSDPGVAPSNSYMPVGHARVGTRPGGVGAGTPLKAGPGNELAAFAQGCFWGSEDTYRQVPGVVATAVGYTGGHTDQPTYEAVCAHTTGHAETVLIEFDPKQVSFEKLVEVFFSTHNPTTRNRQGPDVGDQYRSAVFTFSPEQAKIVESVKTRFQPKLPSPIVTEVAPMGTFWIAEDYHQQYDEKSGTRSCPLPAGLLGGT